MKITLGDIKQNIATMLSMSSTDSRVVGYINEAQERLLYKGKWVGTYAKYAVANSNGTITWPRQLETIEAVAVSDNPGVVRNEWYEFLENGPGLRDSADGDDLTLIDRGEAVVFSDIDGVNKKLRLYSGVTADAGLKVLLQGYDQNGDWIRTLESGSYIDGEYVTLTASYVETVNLFSELVGVQKPVTGGNVTVKEYDTSTATERVIATYEPGEKRPGYRRSLIPGLPDTSTKTVTVVGKLRFIPVSADTDWLLINHEPALKEMVQSIRKAENNLPQEASMYEGRAVKLLEEQLMHYLGDGAAAIPRFQNTSTYGGGGVANLI